MDGDCKSFERSNPLDDEYNLYGPDHTKRGTYDVEGTSDKVSLFYQRHCLAESGTGDSVFKIHRKVSLPQKHAFAWATHQKLKRNIHERAQKVRARKTTVFRELYEGLLTEKNAIPFHRAISPRRLLISGRVLQTPFRKCGGFERSSSL